MKNIQNGIKYIKAIEIVENTKADIRNTMTTKQNQNTTLVKDLTEDEKAYVDSVVYSVETIEEEPANGEESEEVQMAAPADVSIAGYLSKKWVLIGFIAGAFAMACVWAMAYVLSGKVHTADEIEGLTGEKTYNMRSSDAKSSNILDKWFTMLREGGKHYSTASELGSIFGSIITNNSVSKVAIMSTVSNEAVSAASVRALRSTEST